MEESYIEGRRGELLNKFVDETITIKELSELKYILENEVRNIKHEALAAVFIIARIDMMLYDHKLIKSNIAKIEGKKLDE